MDGDEVMALGRGACVAGPFVPAVEMGLNGSTDVSGWVGAEDGCTPPQTSVSTGAYDYMKAGADGQEHGSEGQPTPACWHRVRVCAEADPVTGELLLVVMQTDVTDIMAAQTQWLKVSMADRGGRRGMRLCCCCRCCSFKGMWYILARFIRCSWMHQDINAKCDTNHARCSLLGKLTKHCCSL
jgi:hypothetical protein